jgi:hypothetical protein
MATALALRDPPAVRYTAWQPDGRSILDRYALGIDDRLALRDFCRRLFEGKALRRGRRDDSDGRGFRPYGFRRYLGELADAIDARRESGEVLAPILAERVQLLLERSGQLVWERAFLAVYVNRFPDVHPPYGHLHQRALELQVFPLRRTAATERRPRRTLNARMVR